MSEESQEKQFQASQKRKDDLKKKGSFLRSKDLNSGGVVVMSIAILLMMISSFYQVISNNFILSFTQFSTVTQPDHSSVWLYKKLAINNLLLLLPYLLVLLIVPFVLTFAFSGFGFSWQLVKFKLERINPIKNLGKVFSFSNFIEIFKSILKFFVFISLLIVFIYGQSRGLFQLVGLDDEGLITGGFEMIKLYLLLIIAGVGLIISVDMLYSYFSFQKQTKMSRQEVKDEQKETDGSPEIKRRIRSAQMAMSRQRIAQDVPGATVIITNPTHYAIALKYDDKKDKAPKILAMGVDNMAAEIRLIAIKHGIPIYEAPQLARAIYYTGKVGGMIHPDLYMAVAIVLSYIVQLKHYQMGMAEKPAWVQDLQIPEELHFKEKTGLDD